MLGAFCSGAAHAEEKGLYLGGSAGVSKVLDLGTCSGFPAIQVTSCNIKNTDAAWKLFAGYQLTPFLAFELAYVDLGKAKLTESLTGPGGPVPGELSASVAVKGYSADIVGTIPISGGFSLIQRTGVFRWTMDLRSSGNQYLPGIADPFRTTPTGYNIDFGVGAKWDSDRHLGLRLEFQRFMRVGDKDTGKTDIDLLSASLLYSFK